MLFQDPNAIVTASNISVSILLIISLIVISSVIYNRVDRHLTTKQFIINLINSNTLRIPSGFFMLLVGLLLRYVIRIPYSILAKNGQMETLMILDQVYAPPIYIISEIFIFIGFSIIFWPTIVQIFYRWYGTGYSESVYTNTALFFLLMLKTLLTISGIILYYILII